MSKRKAGTVQASVPAEGPKDEALAREFARFEDRFYVAKRTRMVEQMLLRLFAAGELNGTVHTCVGQELLPAFLAPHLKPIDFVTSNHRGHGHFLAVAGDAVGLLSEVMGRASGVAGGYGGSQHLVGERFFSNGVQGGMTPIAAGIAHVAKTEGAIAACFIGDGTMGEGQFYEALNLASKWELPVLYVVEDNGIAQSTDQRQTLAGDIPSRAAAFGMQSFSADIWDLEQLDTTCIEAVTHVRAGKPALLHVRVARLNSHSKGDDNRADAAIANLNARDKLMAAEEAGLFDAAKLKAMEADVEAAAATARKAPPLNTVERFSPVIAAAAKEFAPLPVAEGKRMIEEINQAMRDAMQRDDGLAIIGEDIEERNVFNPKPYGGAFKATKRLSDEFPGRVRNTPISEGCIAGFASGRALAGQRTIVEIMFGDFCTLIVDQLMQHSAKFPTMFGGRDYVPFMIRTPMGGRRGYGPTHSQSIERLFMGLQNLLLIAPNHRSDVTALYRAALAQHGGPVFSAENKLLYNRRRDGALPPGYVAEADAGPYPTVRVRPSRQKPTCTILTYGFGLAVAEEALAELAMEHEIFAEIICPTALTPFDVTPLLASLRTTQNLVTLEEGGSIGGLGGEALAQAALRGVPLKHARRLANDTIIPCSLTAELDLLPSAKDVVAAVVETAR